MVNVFIESIDIVEQIPCNDVHLLVICRLHDTVANIAFAQARTHVDHNMWTVQAPERLSIGLLVFRSFE